MRLWHPGFGRGVTLPRFARGCWLPASARLCMGQYLHSEMRVRHPCPQGRFWRRAIRRGVQFSQGTGRVLRLFPAGTPSADAKARNFHIPPCRLPLSDGCPVRRRVPASRDKYINFCNTKRKRTEGYLFCLCSDHRGRTSCIFSLFGGDVPSGGHGTVSGEHFVQVAKDLIQFARISRMPL